jgi:hypothetical protein
MLVSNESMLSYVDSAYFSDCIVAIQFGAFFEKLRKKAPILSLRDLAAVRVET